MKSELKIVGGEFEIDPCCFKQQNSLGISWKGYGLFSSGRSALYHILLDIKVNYGISHIFLPDYLCTAIVSACDKADISYCFYNLNNNLEVDRDSFQNVYIKKSAILLINYFGLQDTQNQIDYIRSIDPDSVIIEDDVQSYYEFLDGSINVNYKFSSFRKSFAIPDGGIVRTFRTGSKIDGPNNPNQFSKYKIAGGILKYFRNEEYFDDHIYLSLFETAESMIDDDIDSGMSAFSKTTMPMVDLNKIALIRKRNAKILLNGLNAMGIRPIIPIHSNKIPLFVPIYLNNRDKIRKEFFANNVYCPIHWPTNGLKLKKGLEMAQYELSLIVDQRYSSDDMNFILNILEKSIK